MTRNAHDSLAGPAAVRFLRRVSFPRARWRSWAAWWCAFAAAATAFAQAPRAGYLTGPVENSAGEPLAGVRLRISAAPFAASTIIDVVPTSTSGASLPIQISVKP